MRCYAGRPNKELYPYPWNQLARNRGFTCTHAKPYGEGKTQVVKDDDAIPSIFSMQEFPRAGSLDVNGWPIMVIVDRTGVHHLGVHFCECPGAATKDIQLI